MSNNLEFIKELNDGLVIIKNIIKNLRANISVREDIYKRLKDIEAYKYFNKKNYTHLVLSNKEVSILEEIVNKLDKSLSTILKTNIIETSISFLKSNIINYVKNRDPEYPNIQDLDEIVNMYNNLNVKTFNLIIDNKKQQINRKLLI